MVTYKIAVRNPGHKSQFYTLRVERLGREPEIHTAKTKTYLLQFIPAGAVEVK